VIHENNNSKLEKFPRIAYLNEYFTAASCFGDVGKIGPINKENYLVYLGKYDINKEVEDYSYIKEVCIWLKNYASFN